MDIIAELVKYISQIDGINAVYEEVPHNAIPKNLPVVHLESAGPVRRVPALQHLGADQVGVDVNLYVSESMWKTGEGMRLAHRLRASMYDFRTGQARAVEVSRPEKWPDRNPKSRRIGMTIEVMLPAYM